MLVFVLLVVILEQHDNFIVIDVQEFFINNKIYAKEICVSISDF